MSIHLERDLDELRRGVVALAALVEQAVRDAVTALRTRDAALARRVARATPASTWSRTRSRRAA
jgi:hypothetical protein